VCGFGLGLDAREKEPGHVRGDQTLPILGKDGVVPHLVVHGQADKPAKQQIVIQLLHQQALAANGVQHLEQQSPQQLFRGNGGTSHLGIHGLKLGPQVRQGLIHHRLDRPQRVIQRHSLCGRKVTEHAILMGIETTHNRRLHSMYCYH